MEPSSLEGVFPENTQENKQIEVSPITGTLDPVLSITATQYVATVLTFESTKLPNILRQRKQFIPHYVHHVVLMPLTRSRCGMRFMRPFQPPRYLGRLSKTTSKESLAVSVSIVGLMNQEEYMSEIHYRRNYGIIAQLNFKLVQSQTILSGESFHLLSEKVLHFEMKRFNWLNKDEKAMITAWEVLLLEVLGNVCYTQQPIILD